MLWYLCSISLFVLSANADGEFVVLHTPEYIALKGGEPLKQSDLKDVLSATLGYTVHKGSRWPGLRIQNPFHFAEGVVVLVVDGVKDIGSAVEGQTFAVEIDETEDRTWNALQKRTMQRFLNQNSTLVRLELTDGEVAMVEYPSLLSDIELQPSGFPLQALDPSRSEDGEFLKELQLMKELTRKVSSDFPLRDGNADVIWLVMRSLHGLVDFHGTDSRPVLEAQLLLKESLTALEDAFNSAYNGKVVVAMLTTDSSHIRRTRSLMAEEDTELPDINLAIKYSADFPVVFNIIFWFMIGFIVVTVAIAVAICTMDPGRDSIIYRMTSMRMKKDS